MVSISPYNENLSILEQCRSMLHACLAHLPSERPLACGWIIQFCRGGWSKGAVASPVTRTSPLLNSVAVWDSRGSCRLPVSVHWPVVARNCWCKQHDSQQNSQQRESLEQ